MDVDQHWKWVHRALPALKFMDLAVPGVLEEREAILDERLRRRFLLAQGDVIEHAKRKVAGYSK